MLAHERGRYLVLLAMTVTFLAIVGFSIIKYREKSIGETMSTKKAAKMHFPSLVLCPSFHTNFSGTNFFGTKNLTEYYQKKSPIGDHVLSIHQYYLTDNGLVLLLDMSHNKYNIFIYVLQNPRRPLFGQ